MLSWVSKLIFVPLWQFTDASRRRAHLRALTASEWLNREALREQQWKRVCEAVGYAFRHCSYYQDRLAAVGFDGTLRDWAQFRSLPLLTKRDIRENGDKLLSREFRRE